MFCCSCCSNFGNWQLSQAGPYALFFFLFLFFLTSLFSDAPDSYCVFPAPARESAISTEPCFFYLKWNLETKIWGRLYLWQLGYLVAPSVGSPRKHMRGYQLMHKCISVQFTCVFLKVHTDISYFNPIQHSSRLSGLPPLFVTSFS